MSTPLSVTACPYVNTLLTGLTCHVVAAGAASAGAASTASSTMTATSVTTPRVPLRGVCLMTPPLLQLPGQAVWPEPFQAINSAPHRKTCSRRPHERPGGRRQTGGRRPRHGIRDGRLSLAEGDEREGGERGNGDDDDGEAMSRVEGAGRARARTAAALAGLMLTALLATGAWAPAPAEAGVAKGIVDAAARAAARGVDRDSRHDPRDRPRSRRTLDPPGGPWAALEPTGVYAPAELERLDALVSGLHAAGVKIILTTGHAPTWAQDSSLWKRPPAGHAKGPQSFYAVRRGALDEYGDLAEFLARRYTGACRRWSAGTSPTCGPTSTPSGRPATRTSRRAPTCGCCAPFTPACTASARRAVVAGATAPVGPERQVPHEPATLRPLPQARRRGRHFDVYAHHPYTPGGSLYRAPDQPPNDPSTTVTLYNLSTLLRVFPKKPFYLTEYGYNTKPTKAFGGFAVLGEGSRRAT